MIKSLKRNSASGFTLIELLIVIVIIGILAGVLIGVIDPVAQQNKARDANVKATINKVALATQGYISAYGAAPDGLQFIGGLSTTAAPYSATTCLTGNANCYFTVTGNPLPRTCTVAGGAVGPGALQCAYRYEQVSGPNAQFYVYGKSFGIANTVFRYSNFGATAGQLQHCNDGMTTCVTP